MCDLKITNTVACFLESVSKARGVSEEVLLQELLEKEVRSPEFKEIVEYKLKKTGFISMEEEIRNLVHSEYRKFVRAINAGDKLAATMFDDVCVAVAEELESYFNGITGLTVVDLGMMYPDISKIISYEVAKIMTEYHKLNKDEILEGMKKVLRDTSNLKLLQFEDGPEPLLIYQTRNNYSVYIDDVVDRIALIFGFTKREKLIAARALTNGSLASNDLSYTVSKE